jgi:hypothetical protein
MLGREAFGLSYIAIAIFRYTADITAEGEVFSNPDDLDVRLAD